MRFYRPAFGDERKVKRFALFPIKIRSTIYWLETIVIRQHYDNAFGWINDWVEDT